MAVDFEKLVELTTGGIPTFAPLHKFLLEAGDRPECKISMIKFEDDKSPNGIDDDQTGPEKMKTKNLIPRKIQPGDLEKELKTSDGHQLLLVENLTRNVITLLGKHWNVPPDFFLAHLENSNWYSLQNIPQNLPGLSSIQSLDGYVRFQFIGPREFEIEGSQGPQEPGSSVEPKYFLPDRIHEDCNTASVPRVAGGFNPFLLPHDDPDDAPETKMNPVAFVRNSITIWFDKEGDKWRRGVVLFDPPFVAKDKRFRKRENSKYRSFMRRRPPPDFSEDDIDPRSSYKESFEQCLQHNKQIKEMTGVPRPFVLLEDICRIIASEWLVFNTYIERELNNIESWFEELGENCDEKQLHDLLLQLMRARRRVTKYDTLVSDQLDLCPEHWKHDSSQRDSCPVSGTVSTSFSSPLQDFHQVSSHLTHNKTRISQSIKMVTSLMAVRLNNLVVKQNKVIADQNATLLKQNENLTQQTATMAKQNRLSEARNSSLAFLTGVTSFLLPFTTIAAFLAIPKDTGFGLGSDKQWIYWVASSLLAATLISAFYLEYLRKRHKRPNPPNYKLPRPNHTVIRQHFPFGRNSQQHANYISQEDHQYFRRTSAASNARAEKEALLKSQINDLEYELLGIVSLGDKGRRQNWKKALEGNDDEHRHIELLEEAIQSETETLDDVVLREPALPTFECFSNLPRELRLKIWDHALEPDLKERIHCLITHTPSRHSLIEYSSGDWMSSQPVNPLLHINHESRTQYQLRTNSSYSLDLRTYIDFAKDVIFFPDDDIFSHFVCSGSNLQTQIQKIAMPSKTYCDLEFHDSLDEGSMSRTHWKIRFNLPAYRETLLVFESDGVYVGKDCKAVDLSAKQKRMRCERGYARMYVKLLSEDMGEQLGYDAMGYRFVFLEEEN